MLFSKYMCVTCPNSHRTNILCFDMCLLRLTSFFYSRYHPRETKHNHGDDLIVEVNRYVSYIFLSAMEYTYSEDRCVTRVRTPEFSGSGLPSYYFPVGGITLRYVRTAVYKMLVCFESKASSGQ